ncbi:extracellular solute-binding protein [Micromonospora radicis]|uniref:Extracellular solute-binding protein n=1 Tax=Micromonospora radicis TaxID=1894971 RepID=A0A418MWB3_9ACTN|nr:extracellular solute-binding protein [Micromonospora radicis]RIV39171.1 extracellular solute-binding protein [Micromonospora radicis]
MFNPVPPALGGNRYWQELNDRLGASLDITMTPAADYLNKLSTIIAGGDLPDMMLISARLTRRADVLTRLCADLSDLVSGDAVKDFPFLANIPTDSWLPTAFGSGIYAIPIPRAVVGTIMFSRVDLIRQRGLNPDPANYQEFVELARGLTDARANRWAFGNPKRVIEFVSNMLGVPNLWREEGGKFTSEYETEQRKQALARATEMYQAGLFHPDSVGGKLNLRDLFGNGTIAVNADGYAAWDILASTYDAEVGGMAAPGYDGGPGTNRAGTAIFALTAFKKADPDRLRQLLGICDWLSTPLGTSEYMFRRFGVEGTHYTWQDGVPVRTALGNTEVKLPLEYIAESPHVLGPGDRARVDAQRAYQEKIIPRIVRNPADELQILARIMMPLSKAVLAVVALFNAVSYWSAFFNAVLYINSTDKWPLQLVLRTYVVDNTAIGADLPGEVVPPQQSLQMAILVVSLVPICLVYPFLQRHFAKGLVIGAVKG